MNCVSSWCSTGRLVLSRSFLSRTTKTGPASSTIKASSSAAAAASASLSSSSSLALLLSRPVISTATNRSNRSFFMSHDGRSRSTVATDALLRPTNSCYATTTTTTTIASPFNYIGRNRADGGGGGVVGGMRITNTPSTMMMIMMLQQQQRRTMATKKAAGSSRNGRDSAGRRLGIKAWPSSIVQAGSILVRQRGAKFRAGLHVGMGKDHTLFAKEAGRVYMTRLETNKKRNVVHILPLAELNLSKTGAEEQQQQS